MRSPRWFDMMIQFLGVLLFVILLFIALTGPVSFPFIKCVYLDMSVQDCLYAKTPRNHHD